MAGRSDKQLPPNGDKAAAKAARASFWFERYITSIRLNRPIVARLFHAAIDSSKQVAESIVRLPDSNTDYAQTSTVQERLAIADELDINFNGSFIYAGTILVVINSLVQTLARRLAIADKSKLKAGMQFNGVYFTECLWAGSADFRHSYIWMESFRAHKSARSNDSLLIINRALKPLIPTRGHATYDILALLSNENVDLFFDRVLDIADDIATQNGVTFQAALQLGKTFSRNLEHAAKTSDA